MKETVNYTEKTLQELLALAMAGDKDAAAEIIRRQEEQKQEIEQLKIKASKTRKERAEKTPLDLAKDNAYFRTALLVKQFGVENVTLQTLTVASAYLEQGLAQGNLRQAFNRVTQVLKAQAVEEPIFPAWITEAASEIPVLDENKKLEEEQDKVEQIKSIVQRYMDNEQTSEQAAPEAAETAAAETAAAETAAAEKTPAPEAPRKKAGAKK